MRETKCFPDATDIRKVGEDLSVDRLETYDRGSDEYVVGAGLVGVLKHVDDHDLERAGLEIHRTHSLKVITRFRRSAIPARYEKDEPRNAG